MRPKHNAVPPRPIPYYTVPRLTTWNPAVRRAVDLAESKHKPLRRRHRHVSADTLFNNHPLFSFLLRVPGRSQDGAGCKYCSSRLILLGVMELSFRRGVSCCELGEKLTRERGRKDRNREKGKKKKKKKRAHYPTGARRISSPGDVPW